LQAAAVKLARLGLVLAVMAHSWNTVSVVDTHLSARHDGTQYTAFVSHGHVVLPAGTEEAPYELVWTPDASTPDKLYYQ
jgi:hypothetical protein